MKIVYEFMKRTFIFMCILFTIMTLMSGIISAITTGRSGAFTEVIDIFRIAGVAFVTSLLRSLMLTAEKKLQNKLSFLAIRLLFFPFFLAETMFFMLPVMGLSTEGMLFCVTVFTVTFIIAASIAVPVHNAKKKRYTQRMNEYLSAESDTTNEK